MTELRRTTTKRPFGMPNLTCTNMCDICGKPRAFGLNTYKHTKCSKIRQAHFAALRAKESKQEVAK